MDSRHTVHHLVRQFAGLVALAWALAAQADLVVIVHPDNPVQALTERQVSDLYLGRAKHFHLSSEEVGPPASILEYPANSPLRETFFRFLNGMSLSQINAYWARLRFSGEVLPPTPIADSRSMVQSVSRTRNAIGYVDAATVNDSVKVVLRLKAKE